MLFNEPKLLKFNPTAGFGLQRQRFSALQRAEIAEIELAKALREQREVSFSALQRAEIAEIGSAQTGRGAALWFQCSSTSRNC